MDPQDVQVEGSDPNRSVALAIDSEVTGEWSDDENQLPYGEAQPLADQSPDVTELQHLLLEQENKDLINPDDLNEESTWVPGYSSPRQTSAAAAASRTLSLPRTHNLYVQLRTPRSATPEPTIYVPPSINEIRRFHQVIENSNFELVAEFHSKCTERLDELRHVTQQPLASRMYDHIEVDNESRDDLSAALQTPLPADNPNDDFYIPEHTYNSGVNERLRPMQPLILPRGVYPGDQDANKSHGRKSSMSSIISKASSLAVGLRRTDTMVMYAGEVIRGGVTGLRERFKETLGTSTTAPSSGQATLGSATSGAKEKTQAKLEDPEFLLRSPTKKFSLVREESPRGTKKWSVKEQAGSDRGKAVEGKAVESTDDQVQGAGEIDSGESVNDSMDIKLKRVTGIETSENAQPKPYLLSAIESTEGSFLGAEEIAQFTTNIGEPLAMDGLSESKGKISLSKLSSAKPSSSKSSPPKPVTPVAKLVKANPNFPPRSSSLCKGSPHLPQVENRRGRTGHPAASPKIESKGSKENEEGGQSSKDVRTQSPQTPMPPPKDSPMRRLVRRATTGLRKNRRVNDDAEN